MRSLLGPNVKQFALWVAIALCLYAVAPYLYGVMNTPSGNLYLPYQTNFDDHMVYAAWMRQAQDFHFFFDNRFTTDPQPALTVHLYFFVLGVISKFIGIPLTTVIARLVFSFLFVILVAGLIDRMNIDLRAKKLAVVFSAFAGGIGAMVWQTFGNAYSHPSPYAGLTSGRLPIDVWQPEAFVFSSALTNGLFMASLCLILLVFKSVLDSRESWKPVLWGALGMLLIMNIHSYDMVIVGVVMVGFAATIIAGRTITKGWLLRCCCIALGSLPSALWFMVVIGNDKVFQHRAVTLTYAPSFQQVFAGLILVVLLALVRLGSSLKTNAERKRIGFFGFIALVVILYGLSNGQDTNHFFLSWPVYAVTEVFAIACAVMLREDDDMSYNLVLVWAMAGLVLPFFPALFQRKLGMAMCLPWSLLAAMGLSKLAGMLDQPVRRLALGAGVLILGSSSLLWMEREIGEVSNNVSSTTLHAVYYPHDVQAIIDYLNKTPGRVVVAAPPGQPSPNPGKEFAYSTPVFPDLNPVLSGLSGAYTFAGHWSETPNYELRRKVLNHIFFHSPSEQDRYDLIKDSGIDYLVVPNPEAFKGAPITDLTNAGETVYQGSVYSLIKVDK